ncbi:MAG TPA: DEAD/DEAH box helicase [Solirubrobacteraceae bacterium]|nr:DEAD/DEAH box helicase [Solirubrobacteraceae bacterium]
MSNQSFANLGVRAPIVDALAARKITSPFEIQRLVLPDALAGHDLLVRSPTGSGKTLAFAIPAVECAAAEQQRPSVLILTPTRELATQIVEATRPAASARGVSVAPVYGGVALERQAKLARRAHIVVATPGRLQDLLDRGAIAISNVELLVLDEADRMLDMGFRPAVDRIVAKTSSSRQTLMFSATLDGEVRRVAPSYTNHPKTIEHEAAIDREVVVSHRFMLVGPDTKLPALISVMRESNRGLTLVFVRTKRRADRVVKQLRAHDVNAVAMHGDKSQNQREKALARFQDGGVATMVATDVAARGIDVRRITRVVNFDAPEDRDGYVHRIGRTGRAGAGGLGITFVLDDQRRTMAKIASALDVEYEPVRH